MNKKELFDTFTDGYYCAHSECKPKLMRFSPFESEYYYICPDCNSVYNKYQLKKHNNE